LSDGRRVLVHAGWPKTGTSTIQNVLHANRGYLLERERALYPSLAPNLSNALGSIFKEHSRKRKATKVAGLTDEEVAALRSKHLGALEAELSSGDWETLLLSAEGVSNLMVPEFAKLREWCEGHASECTVLVCVRHPIDWTRSVIQQFLKRGDTLDRLYEDPPTPEYRAKISRAIAAFGRENVRVFDFESATRGGGGIVGAFAREAGLGAPAQEFLASRAPRYNESLSMEAARILDSLNRQRPMFVGDARASRRAKLGRELAYLRRVGGRKFDVPGWVKGRIVPESREDVAWLNETFGLNLYPDVFSDAREAAVSSADGSEVPTDVPAAAEALSDEAVGGLAEVLGELVAREAFHRALERGREALARGNLGRAERMLREAARLDPEDEQPKRLLEEAAARRQEPARRRGGRRRAGRP
jgi:hypothetical protein